MTDAVADATGQRQEKHNEVRQPNSAVNTYSCEDEDSEPYHVEDEELLITPSISQQPGVLDLKACQIFFCEMETLHENCEQIDGKNFR